MPNYVMVTRLATQMLSQPKSFETLAPHVADHVRSICPEVNWLADSGAMQVDVAGLASQIPLPPLAWEG